MNADITSSPDAPSGTGNQNTESQGQDRSPKLSQWEQGAHQAISGLAEGAAHRVERMQQELQHLRTAREEWVECARIAVRERPLAALCMAFAMGALIARACR